ncbi:MAG: cyclic nucleotide-binding domain-containing protein [Cyclobacteriaceae bacterium]|nr:cyclic nucleotide-binding domain-containing protein [Cyclobacteriaceae bacterium]
MKSNWLSRALDLQHGEEGRVVLLLIMSFFMGAFLATFTVAAQTLFLINFDEINDLPLAFAKAGAFGLGATVVYNFLQRRIPFRALAIISLVIITFITAGIEFGERYLPDVNTIYYYGFTQIVPITLITLLIFWGAFNRLFNVRQSKRLLGSVDIGAMIASMISFFAIPVILPMLPGEDEAAQVESLYTLSLISIIIFTVLFTILSFSYAGERWDLQKERQENQKVPLFGFFKNKYLIYLSGFIIISIIAFNFVQYSFLTVSTQRFKPEELANFLALFEATIVIFTFLFDSFAVDRILQDYGLRVSILINPILISLFTIAALIIGVLFGYTMDSPSFNIFFVMIAMSMLFINSTKEALDEPAFKLYQLPIETSIKLDATTKIEGTVAAMATMIAGGLIHLINTVKIFNLLYITLFTIPIVAIWYFVGNKMYASYKQTLQKTLVKNKAKIEHTFEHEYTVDKVLEKELRSPAWERILYSLRLMEKLEPILFENAVIQLAESEIQPIRDFAREKIGLLGIDKEQISNPALKKLAADALTSAEDSDLISVAPEKLTRLSKSYTAADRMLAARLLRKLISNRTIFILLELLRDVDHRVRNEAIITARKVKRPETWPTLIELLSSPTFSHQATAALVAAGPDALPVLESSFHKSGQSDLIMLRIVQIMGRIGGNEALGLLWKKADYPDKRIVKQILYSLRYISYQATGRQAREVMDLLEAEIGKAMWNMAALYELPEADEFSFLRSALREEIRTNNDQITMLMSLLYDPEAVQLVRESIESGDPNGIAYAIELMDLFVDADLKPKLFPLYDDIPMLKKVEQLQVYYPRENYTPVQVINYILNRDFNLNNRWTKVCAVYTSAYLPEFRISRGLIAQMFNRDKLLQETAAWVIYNKDKTTYNTIAERLPARDKKYLDSSISNNQLLDGLNDGFFLGIEMILFLKSLPEFRNISGVLLADLFDKIIPYDMKPGEKISFKPTDPNRPIFFVAHGEVRLKENDQITTILNPGDITGHIFQPKDYTNNSNILEATERSVVFRINTLDFYFVIANHHELVEGIIRNAAAGQNKTT